jgi:hypothetical protein
MSDDTELLHHYVARGREPWNVSLEAAWLDVQMRAYVESRIPLRRPLGLCNVGIGIGLWDDWLGHVVGAPITSVDRDEEICRVFAIRQAREDHPYPARILCGDVLHGVLGTRQFEVITCVGSTLSEAGDAERMRSMLSRRLAPGGVLLCCEVAADDLAIHVTCTATDPHGWWTEPPTNVQLARVRSEHAAYRDTGAVPVT